ncbi:MAG: enoyl-CoA hydratase-related protein [Planctomycetota bacterium]|nr:enoyl-CoA hydratase-related protein [Planctomycetota bacterium]
MPTHHQVLADFPTSVPDQPELVEVRREGDLVWLTINRPEVMNCLSFPTLRRFRTLLAELAEDLSIRCILIAGAGDKAFCAGADLKERKSMPMDLVPEFVKNIRGLMDDVEAMPQPTVAVVGGFAFGGGTELMLACDLRVAARTARFGLTETSLAIIPGAGGTQRLPRLIGKSRAKDLILTGRRLEAPEAETMGLVNRVAEPAALEDAAREVANAIAANGPVAVRAAKAAVDGGSELPQREGLELEARCYERTLSTSDRLEALAAFSEKRKPVFEGK